MALLRRAAPGGKKSRINMDPENVRRGLGQLVLTIMELSRQLLERQAIRRVEAGGLTDGETERLGCAFKALKDETKTPRTHFGLTQDDLDLDLDLGPFGKLL
ncbi:MAG: gas vesicle protein K [Candidatus Riflebacteria bacterium]|nr:gas vesicle protein K [Candidatus Riflebacteria bacterium]